MLSPTLLAVYSTRKMYKTNSPEVTVRKSCQSRLLQRFLTESLADRKRQLAWLCAYRSYYTTKNVVLYAFTMLPCPSPLFTWVGDSCPPTHTTEVVTPVPKTSRNRPKNLHHLGPYAHFLSSEVVPPKHGGKLSAKSELKQSCLTMWSLKTFTACDTHTMHNCNIVNGCSHKDFN